MGKTGKYPYLGALTFEDPHWVRLDPRNHTSFVTHSSATQQETLFLSPSPVPHFIAKMNESHLESLTQDSSHLESHTKFQGTSGVPHLG